MSTPLRLVIFDVDGTLVDSQADIVTSMTAAFDYVGLAPPERETILSIVGLSLPHAMAALAPERDARTHNDMVAAYKERYMALRAAQGSEQSSPLYPGVRAVLDQLNAVPEILLGVATGKSQRGLDALISGHGLHGMFVTLQCADHHPSKPHPSMILQAMADTGVAPSSTIMIGDTSFDMDMARSAGVTALGVSWGYHDHGRLGGAHNILDTIESLPAALDDIWSNT